MNHSHQDMTKGANVIVKTCLGLRAGENLLIVADDPNRDSGLAMSEAGKALGAETTLILIEPRKAHAEDPPGPVVAAMRRADAAVLATVFSLSNSNARREACSAGTRVISLPGCNVDTLTRGAIFEDFEAMAPVVRKLGAVLSKAKEIRVHTHTGTDLSLRLCGRRSVDQTGIARDPGSWAPCPIVETAVGPCEDGVNGVVVADGTLIPGGVPQQPVCMTIRTGKVTSIEGGPDAEKLDQLMRSFNDPNLYQIVEFGMGLNRCARIGRGVMAEDESQFGTVHFGMGDGRTFGLPVVSSSHVDVVIRNPVVSVDGEVILRNERLLVCPEANPKKEE